MSTEVRQGHGPGGGDLGIGKIRIEPPQPGGGESDGLHPVPLVATEDDARGDVKDDKNERNPDHVSSWEGSSERVYQPYVNMSNTIQYDV